MRKRALVGIIALTACLSSASMAATWYGGQLLSQDTAAAANHQKDFSLNNLKMSGICVDQTNKLAYIATNVAYGAAGKIIVMNYQTGQKVGEVSTVSGASQIVIAGDGKAYAVLNERYSQSNNDTPGSSVIRLDNNGGAWSTTKIFSPADVNSTWGNKPIVGIGADAYGRVTITLGSDSYKYNTGYIYDPSQGGAAVLMTSGNTGWSNNLTFYGNGTPVGVDTAGETVLALQTPSGINNDGLHLDGTNHRVAGEFGSCGNLGITSGSTVNVWDSARAILWSGSAGTTSSGSCLLGVNVVRNTPEVVKHAPGLDWNVAKAWIGAMDVNATTGQAWTSVVGEYANNGWTSSRPLEGKSSFGHVYAVDTALNYYDQGRPDATGQVVALANINGGDFLAVTLDGAGNYKLYTTVPEPSSILAMLSGLVGMAGFAIRRRK